MKHMGLITMIRKILDTTLSRCCGVDLRALALFRVGLAITLLTDIFMHAEDMFVFYADSGVLPRAALLEKVAPVWSASLLLVNGQRWFVAAYFILLIFAALFVAIGFHTKKSLFVMWILTIGLLDRNPAPIQAGDNLLRIIQFWGLFLPVSRVWSVDAALSNETLRDDSACRNFASLATLAYLSQLTCLYLMSGLLKTGDSWKDGTAVFYALSLDSFVSDFGVWIRGFPRFCSIATHGTVYFELLAPLFFFIPWRRDLFRFSIFSALCVMHIFFAASLHIGVFGLTDIVALLPLLPGAVFEKVRAKLVDRGAEDTTIVVAEGDSDAMTQARIIKELLLPDTVSICQEPGGIQREEASALSPVCLHVRDAGGKVLEYPESLLTLLRLSRITRVFMPLLGCRLSLALITATVQQLSGRGGNRITPPSVYGSESAMQILTKWVAQGLVVYSLGFIAVVNIQSTGVGKLAIPQGLLLPGRVLHLSQGWLMFSSPPKSDVWFSIPGQLDDGTPVNVLSGEKGPVDFARPRNAAFSDTSLRWRKFYENLRNKDLGAHYRLFFGKYLCRYWNDGVQDKGRRLKTFNFVVVSEENLLTGGHGPQHRNSLGGHICYKDEASK